MVEGLEAGRQASIDSESTYRSAGGSSSGAAEAPKPSPPFALAAAPAGTGSTSAAGAAAAGNLQSGAGTCNLGAAGTICLTMSLLCF